MTGRLWEGDVIWVRTRADGASVTAEELSLAALWRHPGWDAKQDPDRSPAGLVRGKPGAVRPARLQRPG